MNETLNSLNAAIEGKSEIEALATLADLFPREVVFSTSLGYEDQVISDLITKVKVYYPQTASVENMVTTKGPLSFYESIENRKECCFIRKVEPLNRALAGAKIWVTGIRAEQSGNRHDMPQLEWDEAHQLYKFHPILKWSFEEVKTYVKSQGIPYNPLHDKGFVSIGCQPCTRAIQEGEDFRAGRWWWEDESKKECGLHAK
jgi:phosphoadenosine phosphosulfate reductase